MSKTFEQGKDEVAALCEYFAKNQAAFCAPGRKEAHVRQDLIDPFFRALGWDVGNAARVAPQYCEVIVEDSLDIEGQQKAPDYTFRVGTLPKFYTEAKKCGVNIFADPAPAYQLRRYGWSAKVALSILTDFEETGVYDCTTRPRPGDKASHARILYYRFDEYPDRWRELWDIFSHEAVWTGAFDQYAAAKRKRGTSEVDVEFLKELEGWRDQLARNLALRNPKLSGDELNRAVQLTIDRVVFLRMAEDRGLEPCEQLLTLCRQEDIYDGYMKLCRKADDKYNSGLFHFQKEADVGEAPDNITPRLTVDDKVFKPILQSLYFAHGSPYEFKVLPVEILGTVYERFLGKVIRLTPGHQAKIEEKPEVRKAGGVYYTPAYIVNYIVHQTVGRQIDGKSPAQLCGGTGVSPVNVNVRHRRDACGTKPFRVLDMACGSGSFLLGAYQCLLDHCLKWYIDNGPEGFPKAVCAARAGDWRLTIAEKKRILLAHIFGVDIDPQAVEVSKLSLLLKVLEGESAETVGNTMRLFHERALPNLSDNIKCGNSLIGPDYFTGRLIPDAEEFARVNAFDWKRGFPDAMKAGGFDCVIGNPPYIRMEGFTGVKDYLRSHYSAHEERADFYTYFIEKALRLLSKSGLLGMIVSNKFAVAKYGEPLRRTIEQSAEVLEIADFAGASVFRGATVRTLVLVMKPRTGRTHDRIRYAPVPRPADFQQIEAGVLPVVEYVKKSQTFLGARQVSTSPWQLIPAAQSDFLQRLSRRFPALSDTFKWRPLFGIKTGLNEAFIIDDATRRDILRDDPNAKNVIHPFLMGKDVRRYFVRDERRYVIYLHPNKRISSFAGIKKHLDAFRDALVSRATGQEWFELQQPAVALLPILEKPKIVYPIIAPEPRFALDTDGFLVNDKCFVLPTDSLFLLGILNSSLSRMFFGATCARLEGGDDCYYEFRAQFVERFPMPTADLKGTPGRAIHDGMVDLVSAMSSMHKQLASAKSETQRGAIQRQIEATDAEIDRLVYDLYGLTAEEIAIVEGASS
ncbi:MAG: Eco57I restriction-modification methylase domain-containing protein [Phycisphaerae bacterium]|jgi:hypothetical protein